VFSSNAEYTQLGPTTARMPRAYDDLKTDLFLSHLFRVADIVRSSTLLTSMA